MSPGIVEYANLLALSLDGASRCGCKLSAVLASLASKPPSQCSLLPISILAIRFAAACVTSGSSGASLGLETDTSPRWSNVMVSRCCVEVVP